MKKHTNVIKAFTACIVCALLTCVFFCYSGNRVFSDKTISQDDIDKMEQQLEEIRKKQEEHEKELAALLNEQSYTESALVYSQNLITGYTEYCSLLSDLIEGYDAKIEDTAKQIGEKQMEYDRNYHTYLNRLQSAKEEENTSFLELLFDSESILDLINSVERAKDAIKFDRELMDSLLKQQKALEKELEELEAIKENQQKQIDGFEELKDQISKRVDELNAYLQKIENDKLQMEEQKSLYEKMEDDADEAIKDLLEEYKKQQEEASKPSASSKMIWPLSSKWSYISSYYGYRTHPITGEKYSFHRGIDIPAAKGDAIYAALSGTVITSTYNSSYGYYIIIDHGVYKNTGKNLYTVYAHASKLIAKKGQKVSQGERIAKVGTTGSSTGNHLHFEIRLGSSTVNPLDYVKVP